MDGIWGQGRARGYGITALMAVMVFGASVTVRDALTQPASDQQPAGSVYVAPTDAPVATTSEAPAPAADVPAAVPPAPVTAPVADAPAATVETMTAPEPQPATDGVGATGDDGYYTPAPPRQQPGEPPAAPNFGSTGPLGGGGTPMPGEPGYTGDAVVPQIPTR